MGYMHIDNLYKNTDILLFKECYALEKIHGTSAHITIELSRVIYASGGTKFETFKNLFDEQKLIDVHKEWFDCKVVIYGESYGGKEQGMSATYGKEPKFIVFDVKVEDCWLDVVNAEDVAHKFGLEFVPYAKCNTQLEELNNYRDSSSVVAQRRGIKDWKMREGIVLRPLIEFTKSNGRRIIVKHKSDKFKETKTPREVDPESLRILEEAKAIAEEWVTPMRLNHILDKLGNPTEIEKTKDVISAMIEDVCREAKGEIIESRAAKSAIGKEAARLYKNHISKV